MAASMLKTLPMKRRHFVVCAPGLLFAARPPARWLEIARRFADTLLACGLDRLGPKATPAWAGVIDTLSWTVPVADVPPPPGIRPNDRALGGANLYHDAVTLRVFHALSRRTGDRRYRRAADDYMRWFLAACPHPATGLLAWGEHLYYDFTRDAVAAERKHHEFLEWTPPWDLLWALDARAVASAIAGLRYHHFEDRPGALYNRHAWYDRPEHQPATGSQPWIRHAGHFAHAFAFLHAKTGEPRWREWAVGDANIYWTRRHPRTGLTESCIGHPRPSSRLASAQMALLAYWLRKAGALLPEQPLLGESARALIRAWEQYGWNAPAGGWRKAVHVDGTPAGDELDPPWEFAYGGGTLLPYGRIAACFAAWDGDGVMLDTARRVALLARRTPFPEGASLQGLGIALNLALDLHALDAGGAWLQDAERYARMAVEMYWREDRARGLFVRVPGDPYYEAKTGAGEVAAGLLRLDGELAGRRLAGDWTL